MADSPADLEPCFCTAVRQASRHLSQFYDAALAPAGISVNQFAVLARIRRLGPRAMQELAANLVMDRSTLGHLLRPLQARGLVVLAPAADDRRRCVLTLTPAGEALLDLARPLWVRAQGRFASLYGRDASTHLRNLLEEVATLDLGGTTRQNPATA